MSGLPPRCLLPEMVALMGVQGDNVRVKPSALVRWVMSLITCTPRLKLSAPAKEQGTFSDDEFERVKQLTTKRLAPMPSNTTLKQEPLI